jgi:hypothetical protein
MATTVGIDASKGERVGLTVAMNRANERRQKLGRRLPGVIVLRKDLVLSPRRWL